MSETVAFVTKAWYWYFFSKVAFLIRWPSIFLPSYWWPHVAAKMWTYKCTYTCKLNTTLFHMPNYLRVRYTHKRTETNWYRFFWQQLQQIRTDSWHQYYCNQL